MKTKAGKIAVVVILMASTALFAAVLFPPQSDARNLAVACKQAGLAPLPPSARDIRTFRNSTLTWTAYHIKFRASPDEINAFLTSSPGLQVRTVKRFNRWHPYLPLPVGGGDYSRSTPPAYFHDAGYVRQSAPWFDRTVTQAGRRYEIERGEVYGEVVVNDVTDTVFVYMADS